MPRAYGYCRISKGRDTQVYSLDAQTDAIKRYFEYKQRDWGEIKLILPPFKDIKVSGRNVEFPDRPAGAALMGRARKGDHIIVAKADRAFRSNFDQFKTMAMFDKAGVVMHFVDLQLDTSTTIGRMILTVVVAFAQMEADRLRERTREANAVRKYLNMNPNAKAPPGWRFVHMGEGRPRKPKQDQETRVVANRILKLALMGLAIPEIKQVIRDEQWRFPHARKTKSGAWSVAYIERLLKAATYGFPIADKDAEGNLDLPVFEVDDDDEPVMPGGTIFQPDFYPAAEPLRPENA